MKEVIKILESYINTISRCNIFKGINKDELLKLLNCMKPKILNYKSNQTIISSDNIITNIYIVLDGIIEISKDSINGSKIIINRFNKGDIFGEIIALSSYNEANITVTSISDSKILCLDKKIINNLCVNSCISHHKLISNVIQELANKAMILNNKIMYLSIKSIRGKLCTYLYDKHINLSKNKFTLKFNRNELAEYLNVSRPSMSRELGKLKDEKIISYTGRTFEILDLKKLINYVE